jgi:hypothetical protein
VVALAGYIDKYTFARSDAFGQRVQMACVKQALDILDGESPVPANTVFRQRLAHEVLSDPTVLAIQMALGIVMFDLGVGDDVNDAAIQNFVAQLWDFYCNPGGA